MSRCEDYPCCGHELGDCNGSLYGSDESIRARVEREWGDGHGYCDHPSGVYQCAVDPAELDDEEDDTVTQDYDEYDETSYIRPWEEVW